MCESCGEGAVEAPQLIAEGAAFQEPEGVEEKGNAIMVEAKAF